MPSSSEPIKFMATEDFWQVEVVYALAGVQRLVGLQVAPGTTARQASEQSGLNAEFPG
ncbi:MAG: RnfH family protein, partial [Pseudomonadota bacterium]